MLNHKEEIRKLEKIVSIKMNEIKCLREEVSTITTKIAEYNRLYNENNKSSIEAKQILDGYSRQTLSEIVLFFMKMFTEYGTGRPKSILNKIDYEKAIKDEEFFNQVIISIGRPTVQNLFKNMEGVGIDDEGQTCLIVKDRRTKDKNLGDRLFSKLTKKSIEDYIIRQGYLK